MYRPIKANPTATTGATSLFAKGGINLRDLAELLDPKFALDIKNYVITSDGGLDKRKGYTNVETVAGSNPVLAIEKWTDDLILYAYGTTLAVYSLSADTSTVIKSNFNASQFEIKRYGDYAFIASPEDKIGRLSFTLDYDTQTSNFTAGLVVTGATSGATALILSDVDGGATGTLTLGSITGTFADNEIITDTSTGSATVNGTLDYTYTTITAAPMASVLEVIGARLYAGYNDTVQYSEVDNASNPPFNTWSNTTNASDGGKVSWRGAGNVTCIKSLGSHVVVFAENGKWAFSTDTIDSGGTLKKVDNVIMDRKDFGGARGAIVTPKGLFYVNEAGLWQLVSIGQPNIPYSDQESMASVLLGTKYFDDINLSDADLAFDKKLNTLLITCAKDSDYNNLVLSYNVIQQAFARFNGWNINRFLDDNGVLYGGSAIYTKIDKLFDGNADGTNDIWTEFYTELKGGDLETRQDLLATYIKGKFSASTTLQICYDIYDKNGTFIEDKMCQEWSAEKGGALTGWGTAGWGTSSFGGDESIGGEAENFAGARNKIANFQRLRVKIKGNDKVPHSLTWLKLLIKGSKPIRRRNLVKL